MASLGASQAYLDGELCGVGPNGITSFSIIQLASDSGNAAALVFFLFDLLYIDGEDLSLRTLIERKDRLAVLLANVSAPLHYFDHQIGHGRAFFEKACAMSLEGIVSKRTDAAYPALVGNISFGRQPPSTPPRPFDRARPVLHRSRSLRFGGSARP